MVHKRLEHVYAKLGVDSRAAAVTAAFEQLGGWSRSEKAARAF
jgi:DNA-binding CsgD family transcriptional regulator